MTNKTIAELQADLNHRAEALSKRRAERREG